MKSFYFLLITLLFVTAVQAQNATAYTGRVADATTKSAISGVTIFNINTNETTQTNELGVFQLYKNLSNADTILISAINYQSIRLPLGHLSNGGETLYVIPKNVQLNEVIVASTFNTQHRLLSQIDVNLRGINNSQEVLRVVPGLFIGQHAGGGKAEQIFLRGFDIDHGTDISLFADGIPVNMVSHAHGQGYADLHFLIPELIGDVNFKKGPYDAEKGNFTTTGFVDFTTKNVLNGSSVKIEGGMFNTFRTVGLFDVLGQQAKENGQSFYLATEYLYTKGYFEHPQNFSRENFFGKYYGKLSSRHTASLSLSFFESNWKASGQVPERAVKDGTIGYFGAVDPDEGGATLRTNVNLQLLTTLSNNSYLKHQVYYTYYNFDLFSNFTFFKNDPVNGDQIRQREGRHLMGYNSSYTDTNYWGNFPVTTEIGTNVKMDQTLNSELSKTIKRNITAERIMLGDIKELNLAAYINQTFKFNNRITANTGLRYDYFINKYNDKLENNKGKVEAAIVSPKLNLQYHFNNKAQLFIKTGKGFHSNDTRVAVPQNGRSVLPAAWGADVGTIIKPTGNLLVNWALWYLWLEEEFIYVGDEGIVEPSGESRRVGIDLSVRYQPIKWLFLDFDLSLAKPKSLVAVKGEDYLPLAPLFTSAGGLTVKTKKAFDANLRYRYLGDRPANEDWQLTAKGYFIMDAGFNYNKKKFEIGVHALNLFNIKWKETQFETESKLLNEPLPVSEIHFTPGTPFFLKASLTYNFK